MEEVLDVLEKPKLERNEEIALKAVQLLINAVELAQRRGAYSLQESAEIWKVISLFTAKPTDNTV
jgi:hypothetical protein